MRSVTTPVLAASLAALLGACGSTPAPSPSPAPSPGGLRPLTSRDDATPPFAPATPEGLPPGHPPVDGGRVPTAPLAGGEIGGGSVSGTVRLAPSLKDRQSPSDVLYIIARNRQTNAVVAVRREEGVRFPYAFEISAADIMVKDTPFTGPLDVTARLSKTGEAIAGKGDVEGTVRGVAVGTRNASITLDTVRQ